MRDGENINVFMYHSKSALAYGASNSKPLSPMYVWIHGGGWAYGEGRDSLLLGGVPDCNVSVVDSSTNAKSTINNLVIASIEHRLPPEYKVLMLHIAYVPHTLLYRLLYVVSYAD